MKKLIRRCLALAMSAVFVLTCTAPVFAAGTDINVQLDVTYSQTDAREMLTLVNNFRTGNQAWYWNEDNSTKTDQSGKLQGLTYDYNLERVAMQRAAEIVVTYSHTRPDGSGWDTAYGELGANYRSAAENIAVGYTSAEDVFVAWREDDEDYAGQGHRRNMLSEDVTSIGIAHVVYGEMDFWVQEFGTLTNPNTTPTTPATDATVDIRVASSSIRSVTLGTVSPLSLEAGKQADLPTVSATLKTNDTWAYTPAIHVDMEPGWTVTAGSDVVKVEGDKLTALSAGSATLSATVAGQTVTCSVTVTSAACEHQWNDGVVTTEATCTAEGVRTYTCQQCGATRTEAIPMKPHTVVTDPAVAATCTHTGLTEGSHCSVCNTVIVAQTVVAKLPHDYVASVTTAPTCTTDGVRTYTCSACSDSYTEDIPATGHTFGPWTTVTSPTCTQNGSEQRICSVCQYTETRGVDPTGHTWEENYTIDQAPTCTQDGSKSIHCSKCDAVTDVQTIPATGHTWDEGTVVTAPTCTQAGTIRYTCTVCKDTRDETIPAAGHTWDQGTVTTPATCTQDGTMHYTCTVCQETRDEVIPATGHTWDQGTVITPSTCTTDGLMRYTCTVCDETRDEVIPASHSYVDKVTAPTCTQAGYTTHTCSVCGDTYTDTPVAALGHSYEWVVDQKPTATQAGSRHQVCSVCGAQGATEAIPATGTQPSTQPSTQPQDGSTVPPTGDQSHLTVYVGILAVCVLALAGTGAVVVRRRRR
ncbi:MAG TPA: hypothetical protein IAC27_02275 [Candidatus Enterenecus avicola]|nr:hypothetical protein [Candidatus Enterenecus avicola]